MDGIEQSQKVETLETEADELRSNVVIEVINKDSEYEKKLAQFKQTEEKRIQAAEKKLLPRCSKCSKALRSKMDVTSNEKNQCCFSCYSTHEKGKTNTLIDTKFAEQYDRIAALDFPDFENWLFGDELGERSLMRIIMKIKREGYDIPTWKISLAATAWAMDNFANTNLNETRHILERAPISQIIKRVPENNDDVKKIIHQLSAESQSEDIGSSRKRLKKEYIYMGLLGGISIMLPILMNKGR